MDLFLLAYVALGLVSGVLAGLLGISGGAITIPILFVIFQYAGIPAGDLMHTAIGTSFAVMTLNSLAGAITHNLKRTIDWKLFSHMALPIIGGAIVGAYVAMHLSGKFLEHLFGLFLTLLSIDLVCSYFPRGRVHRREAPHWLYLAPTLFAGFSTLVGVGGGVLFVPYLLFLGMKEKPTIATSAVIGFIITLIGTIFFSFARRGHEPIAHEIGFLYLPAFIPMCIASFLAAPFGALLTYKFSSVRLRHLLAGLLLVMGLLMGSHP